MQDAIIHLTLRGSGPGSLAMLRRQLERPEKLLKLFGFAAASEAQKSFDRQGLNYANEWPVRYPTMEPPVVNVAGALADLAKGPTIKPHRFENRPAVIDTGTLRRSLSPGGCVKIMGTFAVEVGTVLPYGSMQQFGGEHDIPITQTQKDNLRAWYKKQKRAAKKSDYSALLAGKKPKPTDGSGSAWLRAIMGHLGFILNSDSMNQTVLARPFVGLNTDLAADMRKIAVDFYAGKGLPA